jgi:hypothetical protein
MPTRDAADTVAAGPAARPLAGGDAPATDGRRERRLVWMGVFGAALTFAMLGSLWLAVPTYRPADEASHVAYARELSHGRLPTIDTVMSADGDPRLARMLAGRDKQHRTIWTANHPPLYYALVAVPLRIGSASGYPLAGVQAARLLSLGLSALGLVALAYVVLQLVPGRPQLAVAAAGLAGLLPSFVSISARVYNDSLAFLAITVAVAASVVFVIRGPSAVRLAAVAASASLAALTRASGLLVVGLAGLAVLIGVWRASPDPGGPPLAGLGGILRRVGRAVLWAGVVGVAVVAVAGWFYLRNRRLYGDLTGSAALLERFDRPPAGSMLGRLTDPTFWRAQQEIMWRLEPDAVHPGPVAQKLWLLGLVPLAGLLLAGRRWLAGLGRGRRPDVGRLVGVGLCVLLLGLLQLSVVQLVSDGHYIHARYLFPGLVTIGLAAAVGLAALPGGRRGLPAVAMLLAMTAVNLWVWGRHLDVLSVDAPPWLLAAVLPPLLVGLALQAVALWRLAPDAERP